MAGADSGADLGDWPGWRWDGALSFAGAQQNYVEQVAEALKARGVRCFSQNATATPAPAHCAARS